MNQISTLPKKRIRVAVLQQLRHVLAGSADPVLRENLGRVKFFLELFLIVPSSIKFVAQGKPLGRPKVDPAILKRIQDQLRAGNGIIKVAHEIGVGVGTVQRIKQEMKGPFVGAAA
jgi:hypothetical protein